MHTVQEIRHRIIKQWYQNMNGHKIFNSDQIRGSSPPSVFVGEYGYPKVRIGPMVPEKFGDTSILDAPEKWIGRNLDQIINFRLNLIKGVKQLKIEDTTSRYIQEIQDIAMSSKSPDSELQFVKKTSISFDNDELFGPMGEIKNIKISNTNSVKSIQTVFYDKDLKANDAIINLYNKGLEVSKIHRCLSVGMLGSMRKLVPTKWSITATDSIISQHLVKSIINNSIIDSNKVFTFTHLDNVFVVILFPHRWMYEMAEVWTSNGVREFGSDSEIINVPKKPNIAGAYFAAKLAVAEYLHKNMIQAGVIVLREIRPEYAIPVGVWQIREGIRQAMMSKVHVLDNFQDTLSFATSQTSIPKLEWLHHITTPNKINQSTLESFS